MTPRTAAIYARVSTEAGGRDHAVSIGEQIESCKALAATNGDRVVAVYIDDRRYRSEFSGRMVEPSAKRPDRPDWKRMLGDAGKGWRVLYAWRTDRICRGNETTGMFERVLDESHIDVQLITQTFDRDSFGLLAGGVSGYELRNIAVRTNMGREGRVRGGLHSGPVPYGYRRIKDDEGKTVNYELTPEGQAFLARLAALFLARLPLRAIGETLGPPGRPISYNNVTYWLTNPFYRGRLVYGRNRPAEKVIYNDKPVPHAPAWDAATIAALDRELERRRTLPRGAPRRRKWDYLIDGVLVCAICRRPLVKNGYDVGGLLRYACVPMLATPAPQRHRTLITERRAVKQIIDLLAGLTPELIDNYLDANYAPAPAGQGTVGVQAEVDQLEAKLADLRIALAQVQDIAPAAAALIEREAAAVAARLLERRAEVDRAQTQDTTLARDDLRARMLELLAARDVIPHLARADLSELFKRTLPPLYVQNRRIVAAPVGG